MTYEEIQKLRPGDMLDVKESTNFRHREIVTDIDEIYITTVRLFHGDVVQKRCPIWQVLHMIEKVSIQWD